MPKKLHKNLKLYLSKLKRIRTLSLPNPPTTNSLLSACKYPKTPSFARDRAVQGDGDDTAATLSDVDRFLRENFQSLYIHDDDTGTDDDGTAGRPPIRPSDRFFVSPSTSNSIVDEARTSGTSSSLLMTTRTSLSSDPELAVPGDGVAVMTFSKDPYDDFRRSMQDMVESRHADPRQGLDWDFMEELLFCYLELNNRSVHKHVLKAFTDLTAGFRRKVPATERRKVPSSTETRARRRRRKACRDWETSTEMAPQEKVKECYYDHRKHVET